MRIGSETPRCARVPVTLSGWQPIETAPRQHKQVVLLYGEEYGRRIWGRGYYFKGVPGDGEGWVTSSFYTEPEDDSRGIFTPTHWMPMPKSATPQNAWCSSRALLAQPDEMDNHA